MAAHRDGPARCPTAAAWTSPDAAPALPGAHSTGGRRLLPHSARPGPDARTVRPVAAPLPADAALLGPGPPARNARPGARGPARAALALARSSGDPRLSETDRAGRRRA